MSLQSDLDNFRNAWLHRVGGDIAGLVSSDIAELRASGILTGVAREGSLLPNLNLLGPNGQQVALAGLAEKGPLVLTFYRGGWCPYCNLELRAYQQRMAEFAAFGATLVAVSPEQPDHSLDTAAKNALTFPVLSDHRGELAEALGIRFRLTPAVAALYEKFGHDLPSRNGDGDWSLPMPATFVVARGGVILKSFVEPDYRIRLDPGDALAVLATMEQRAA